MDRKEMITSREYWLTHIEIVLYMYKPLNRLTYRQRENIANKIVDKYFMDTINELTKLEVDNENNN